MSTLQIARAATPGRKSSKVLQGCTICASCRWGGSDLTKLNTMTDRLQKWEAKLDGHEWDLEKLPAFFADQGCRVTERDGEYVLTSHELESSRNHEEASSRAEQLVSRINGAMRLCDGEYRPVRFAHVVGYTESGRPVRTISLSSTGEIRFRVDFGDGSRAGGDPWVARLIALAENDHDLSRILVDLSDESIGWSRLYKVFERIEKCAGGDVVGLRWCARQRRGDFKYSANSPLTGDGARHAVLTGSNPKPPPMSLEQARSFVLGLARKLVDHVT